MTAPALRLVRGGGYRNPLHAKEQAAPCAVCSVPHNGPCGILRRHVEWMRLRGLAATTVANRRAQVRLLALALPVPVLDATPDDLMVWRAGMRREPGGVCNAHSHVQQFYLWAVADGLIRSNPAAGLPLPRRPRRLPRPIGEADLLAALDGAPQPVRAWIVLAAFAAFRAKECALLRADCVRLDGPEPWILVASDATKGRTERVAPASAFVAAELRAYGVPASGFVFRRADGGFYRPHHVSHMANDYLRSAGLAAEFHQLRHRALTTAYRGSLDIRAVQALAGHQSIETTALYTAFADGAVRAAVDAIPVPPQFGAGRGRRAARIMSTEQEGTP